jgi:hypothetical protein
MNVGVNSKHDSLSKMEPIRLSHMFLDVPTEVIHSTKED